MLLTVNFTTLGDCFFKEKTEVLLDYILQFLCIFFLSFVSNIPGPSFSLLFIQSEEGYSHYCLQFSFNQVISSQILGDFQLFLVVFLRRIFLIGPNGHQSAYLI